MTQAHFIVQRGQAEGEQTMVDYTVDVGAGMVVLDAIHQIQATQAPDLAVRWNCKAAKCGSCSAEVNGKPALMCKTRLDDLDLTKPVEVRPMKTFPQLKDLVTDVGWNYEINKLIKPFKPTNENTDEWVVMQEDIERAREFRKCIECFMCQNACHVLRNHDKKDLTHREALFAGPRFMIRLAGLEMHPMDGEDRMRFVKDEANVGYCNITKCCTEVCPEEIKITDNAIIPLKERVIDRFYDPIAMLLGTLTGRK
ncbi:MAG: succinate dehydrogenase/fumarate reductase iron-sulfur subunit [Cyanobacteria bacterium HKST-UBA04]|nr:succinate dehydrogenase/fumarate reductase iron-sulfur subunit [Cyanobacteria bacterium HKST-UBA04]MCA9841460.1 succinate dehydrogenase/fumarate reductase iron-sulfur subunit [Cyanobacteria bacterium HKST-UBA03]